jgi:hypothetical protein
MLHVPPDHAPQIDAPSAPGGPAARPARGNPPSDLAQQDPRRFYFGRREVLEVLLAPHFVSTPRAYDGRQPFDGVAREVSIGARRLGRTGGANRDVRPFQLVSRGRRRSRSVALPEQVEGPIEPLEVFVPVDEDRPEGVLEIVARAEADVFDSADHIEESAGMNVEADLTEELRELEKIMKQHDALRCG